MDQLLFFGDEVLQSLNINMDHLVDFRRGAMEYMAEMKHGLMTEWYNEKEKEEKRQEILLDEHQNRLQRINEEFLTKYKERNNYLLTDAIRKTEEANEVRRKEALDKENKRKIMENIFVDLVRRIRNRRCPQMAKIIMIMLLKHHERRERLHEELLIQSKERNNDLLKDAIRKLEEANEARRKEALEKENRRRVFENICVDLVRRIREKRCPQMAKKIMIMLLDNHEKRERLHEELLMKLKKKEELKKIKISLQMEMMEKVKEREHRISVKKQIHKELLERMNIKEEIMKVRARIKEELLGKVREMKIRQQIRSYGYEDLMSDQIEKPEELEDFLPRKLFLFGVDSFSSQSKIKDANIKETVEKKNCQVEDRRQLASPQKSKTKTSIKNRLRRFLGLK